MAPGSQAGALADRQSDLLRASEEVIALVVDDDECREVFDLDPPHGLHTELGILEQLHLLDAIRRKFGSRTADGAEIEAPVLRAGIGSLDRKSVV